MRRKKLVYFHPTFNIPPLCGSDLMSLEILRALAISGFDTYLFLTDDYLSTPATLSLPHAKEAVVYPKPLLSPYLRFLFRRFVEKVSPDVIFMNYVFWDHVLDHRHFSSVRRILFNHEWFSGNVKMKEALKKGMQRKDPLVYHETFYRGLSFEPDEEEMRLLDQYDSIWTIPDPGSLLFEKRISSEKIFSFPCTLSEMKIKNTYSSFPLLPLGPNPFNMQGREFFFRRVLPLLRKKEPSFRIRMSGFFPEGKEEGVLSEGFVPDMKPLYEQAAFLLAPVFGGTGQQLKILEGMNAGLAVVCMKNPHQYNPVVHGETGFLAETAEEFSEYVRELFLDREKAAKMGKKGKEVFQNLYAPQYFIHRLRGEKIIRESL